MIETIRDWMIQKLGGVTKADHAFLQTAWDAAVVDMTENGKVLILDGYRIDRLIVNGPLVMIIAPNSPTYIQSIYCEKFLP